MKSPSAIKAVYRVVFVALVLGIRVFAGDVPKFSDPDVTLYVKAWSKYVRDYAATTAHWKTADRSSLLTFLSRARELQSQAGEITSKVKPDEKQKFMEFMGQCLKDISDSSSRLKKSVKEPLPPNRAGRFLAPGSPVGGYF